MKTWQRRLWKGFAAAFAAVVILLATLVGVFRLLAPLVPGYRQEVEKWAAHALDRPVSIAGMGARWDWYGPELTLNNVKLYSHDGKYVVVTAHEIRLGVTVRALLHGNFSTPSRIMLVSPNASVVRESSGRYTVLGFGDQHGGTREIDWHGALNDAFNQSAELVVRDGSVRLLDRRRPGAPFVFSNVDIKLENAADTHSVSGQVQLPQALGRTLVFSTDVEGTGLHPETWKWRSQFDGQGLQLPMWLAYWPQYRNRFLTGSVDVHADLAGEGPKLTRLKMRLGGHDLVPAAGTAHGFSALSGQVEWSQRNGGWLLQGRDIKLTANGRSWPVSHFQVRHDLSPEGQTWQADASFLRLQDIDTLIGWLPAVLSSKLQTVRRLAPQGEVTGLQLAAQWQQKTLGDWSVHGKFEDLGAQAEGRIPGFSGLDGNLDMDQTGGTLILATRNGSLTFPHLFRGPLSAAMLNATIKFNHQADGWHIESDDIAVQNQDGHATGKGSFFLPADGSSPQLDLDASVGNVDVRNKSTYFPVGIMPKPVVRWLDNSIISGQVPQGTLSVHGKLAGFPYDKGQGLFDIRFHLIHGVLDYAPGWPRVENLDADVEFRNQGLSAEVRGGTILGDDISGAKAGFADLRNGILRIDGGARGGAGAALEFLRNGPLKDRFGDYLNTLQVAGRGDVTLHLTFPVKRLHDFRLDGEAHLRNVAIRLPAASAWAISDLNGDLNFTNTGVSAKDIQGRMLGEPLTINLQRGEGDAADTTVFEARGGADSAALMAGFGLTLKDALQGQTTWSVHGRIPNNPAARTSGLSLAAHSDLTGLAINLPAPLAKTADTATPLDASWTILGGGRTQLDVDYADRGAAQLQFQLQNHAWHFDRGAISVGSGSVTLPATLGLSINGKLNTFDTVAWRKVTGTDISESGAQLLHLPALLKHVDLEVEHFSGFGQTFNGLHLLLEKQAQSWRIELASAAIGGRIDLPFRVDAQHPIVADMDHVMVQREPSNGKPAETPAPATRSQTFDPRRIPAVNFSSKLLEFSGVSLSQVHAVLMPRPDGINLASFSVDGQSFKTNATGNWVVLPDGTQHSHLVANISSDNIQQTLTAFGYAPGITGNRGTMQAEVDWNGGPFGAILPSLSGKLHLKLSNGQLLEVKPGAGRVFGLLSLNALPRRLLLNFSDVFGTGFAYDTIEGNFLLQHGDAYTSDMSISGPAARIHVLGRIGLAKHDFDEALIVNASVGSTLPVIGALAGGVGVGAVVWLLTEVFKKPLTAVGEVRYRLTGTWDNPKLEKVAESPNKKTPPPQAAHP